MDAPTGRQVAGLRPLALTFAAGGAVVAVIGCLLPWIRVDLGRFPVFIGVSARSISAAASGLGAWGTVAVTAAIAMLLLTAALLIEGLRRFRRAAWALLAVAGAIVMVASIVVLTTKGARADHVLRSAWERTLGRGLSNGEFLRLRGVLARLGEASSIGPGVIVSLAGGALGAAGGVMASLDEMRAARIARRMPYTGGFASPPGGSAEPPA